MAKPKKQKGEIIEVPTQSVPVRQSEQFSVESMITMGIEKGIPVESLERLLAMRTQLKQEFAEEAANKAFAKLQSELPIIGRSVEGYGYSYAPLEDVVEKTIKHITSNGFSYWFETSETDEKIIITCIAKHELGAIRKSSIELPKMTSPVSKTGKQSMNNVQTTAATITYGKRYSYVNLFGIIIGNEDTDGVDKDVKVERTVSTEYVEKPVIVKQETHITTSKIQLDLIKELIARIGTTYEKIEDYTLSKFLLKIDQLSESQADALITVLREKVNTTVGVNTSDKKTPGEMMTDGMNKIKGNMGAA
jgi:hypothetical protein